MATELASHILLMLGVAVAVLSAIGLMLVRSSYDRLHLLGPVGLLAAPLLAVAIVLRQGDSLFAIKTGLTALLLMASGPVLSHALGRSFHFPGNRRPGRPVDARGQSE